jgi:hypothetical protein
MVFLQRFSYNGILTTVFSLVLLSPYRLLERAVIYHTALLHGIYLFGGFGFGSFRCRVSGFGFRVSGFGFRVSGFGFQVKVRIRGSGVRVTVTVRP